MELCLHCHIGDSLTPFRFQDKLRPIATTDSLAQPYTYLQCVCVCVCVCDVLIDYNYFTVAIEKKFLGGGPGRTHVKSAHFMCVLCQSV